LPFRDPKDALEDILENIARIERFVEGLDEQAFYNDEKTIFSVNYALLAISEAARRLGGKAEKLCPDMPWQQIRGLGNVLRHGYDRINPKTIWTTVQNDLRPLQLAAHLALIGLQERDGPDGEPSP
jgi:uncharacterized protein with HEPN domain